MFSWFSFPFLTRFKISFFSLFSVVLSFFKTQLRLSLLFYVSGILLVLMFCICVCVSVGMGTFFLFNSFVGLQLFFSFLSVFKLCVSPIAFLILFAMRCRFFVVIVGAAAVVVLSTTTASAFILVKRKTHTLALALCVWIDWQILYSQCYKGWKRKREWVKNKLKCFDWRYCERVCESCFVYGRIECLRWDKGFL